MCTSNLATYKQTLVWDGKIQHISALVGPDRAEFLYQGE